MHLGFSKLNWEVSHLPFIIRLLLVLVAFCAISIPPSAAQEAESIPDFLRDLNQDGAIDFKDLLILIESWGLEGIATPTPTPTQTPTNPNLMVIELAPLPTPLPIRLVRIPAGSFMMGSPETERGRSAIEGPQHLVTIDYDFFMGETEVTRSQWQAVMGSLPNVYVYGIHPDHPIYHVSWNDCQDFLTALNAMGGEGTFRLPSEAEWEYACRAGTTSRFYFGNSPSCEDECQDCDTDGFVIASTKIDSSPTSIGESDSGSKIVTIFKKRSDYMWFCANADAVSQVVRQKIPNAFGLYDMLGNMSEWVQDDGHSDYFGAPTDGSAWESTGGGVRMVRGGSYFGSAQNCRSASRGAEAPNEGRVSLGFRVVWTPD